MIVFSAFSQMALQLTMHRLTGGIVPTYESASTRRCAKETCVEISLIAIDVIVINRLSMLSSPIRLSPNCRYRLGRVDSIRASHPEASAWCHAMEKVKDNSKDKAVMSKEARSMFEVAMKKQTKVRV